MKKPALLLLSLLLLLSVGTASALPIQSSIFSEDLDGLLLVENKCTSTVGDYFSIFNDDLDFSFYSALKDGKEFVFDFGILAFEKVGSQLFGELEFTDMTFFFEGEKSKVFGTKVFDFQVTSVETAPVPEPASLFLLGSGLLGFWGVKRRKMKGGIGIQYIK